MSASVFRIALYAQGVDAGPVAQGVYAVLDLVAKDGVLEAIAHVTPTPADGNADVGAVENVVVGHHLVAAVADADGGARSQ